MKFFPCMALLGYVAFASDFGRGHAGRPGHPFPWISPPRAKDGENGNRYQPDGEDGQDGEPGGEPGQAGGKGGKGGNGGIGLAKVANSRQADRQENADNHDDDQQLDEREGANRAARGFGATGRRRGISPPGQTN